LRTEQIEILCKRTEVRFRRTIVATDFPHLSVTVSPICMLLRSSQARTSAALLAVQISSEQQRAHGQILRSAFSSATSLHGWPFCRR